jgi:hypothetical protein
MNRSPFLPARDASASLVCDVAGVSIGGTVGKKEAEGRKPAHFARFLYSG